MRLAWYTATAGAAMLVGGCTSSVRLEDEGEGARGRPTDPNDAGGAAVHEEQVRQALEGTHWTAKLEGSLGTYITWFSFEAADVLTVTHEVRQAEDASEVLWVNPGSWSVTAEGDVERDWDVTYFDGEASDVTTSWTFAPLRGPLRDKLAQGWWQVLDDGPVWSQQTLLAQSNRTYRGHYEHWMVHPSGDDERRLRSATVTFDAPPTAGAACSVQVKLAYVDSFGEQTSNGDWSQSFGCTVTPDPEGPLWRIDFDGFGGDDAAVASQWSDYLASSGLPLENVDVFSESFAPRLYLDPDQPDTLGYVGWATDLLEGADDSPPSP